MPQHSLLAMHGPSIVGTEPITLHAALQAHGSSHIQGQHSRLYVYAPDHTEPAATVQLLSQLSQLYGVVGAVDPQLDVVPLLPFAGWTLDAISQLPELRSVIATNGKAAATQQLLDALTDRRSHELQPLQLVQLEPSAEQTAAAGQSTTASQQAEQPAVHLAANSGGGGAQPAIADGSAAHGSEGRQQPEASSSSHDARSASKDEQLVFKRVAVGGTFDRLHAGHRLLLAATALVATENVFVGVTADALLAKKANKELLQQYDERLAAALDFMVAVRPALVVSHGALTDPQAPTQAELDPHMEALVVSQETLPGGQAINRGRLARGFAELALVVVELVGGGDDGKLSSTALRSKDAAGPS